MAETESKPRIGVDEWVASVEDKRERPQQRQPQPAAKPGTAQRRS